MSGSSCEMTYASQVQQIWFFGVLSMSSHQTTLKLRRPLLPASGENILPAWSSQKMNHCLEGRQTHYTVIDAQLENHSCRFFPTGMIHCLERTTERSRLYERKVFWPRSSSRYIEWQLSHEHANNSRLRFIIISLISVMPISISNPKHSRWRTCSYMFLRSWS